MTSKENVVKIMGKARSKAMRKNILALAPSQLYDILEYKCTIRELYFSKVDPAQSEQALLVRKSSIVFLIKVFISFPFYIPRF